MQLHVVSQNVDGDGPSPIGDIVMTQESSPDIAKMHGYRIAKSDNYQIQTAWVADGKGYDASETVTHRLAKSGRAFGLTNFGPTRSALVTQFNFPELNYPVFFINSHWTNSAWDGPTWADPLRKRLWLKSAKKHQRIVKNLIKSGGLVIAAGDYNYNSKKLDKFFPGMRDVFGSGLGRVFVLKDPRAKVIKTWHGPKVGNGRVTHVSDHVILELTNKKNNHERA